MYVYVYVYGCYCYHSCTFSYTFTYISPLFSALKTRGNTPKYGLIFHSSFIGRAGQKNKGRISRYLANKCSIAARIDCFTEIPTSKFGDALRGQVEDRLVFYETGKAPARNVDVMKGVISSLDSGTLWAQ